MQSAEWGITVAAMERPIEVDLPHKLGREEARRRIAGNVHKLSDHIPGGTADVKSNWVGDQLKAGDTIEVMVPHGSFTTEFDAANPRHLVGIAGGSGITPVMSLIRTLLREEPESRFTLLYGNRDSSSIIFLDELDKVDPTDGGFGGYQAIRIDADAARFVTGEEDRERQRRVELELCLDDGRRRPRAADVRAAASGADQAAGHSVGTGKPR